VQELPTIHDLCKRRDHLISQRMVAAIDVEKWNGWNILVRSLHVGHP
jgi:hypothetical protein